MVTKRRNKHQGSGFISIVRNVKIVEVARDELPGSRSFQRKGYSIGLVYLESDVQSLQERFSFVSDIIEAHDELIGSPDVLADNYYHWIIRQSPLSVLIVKACKLRLVLGQGFHENNAAITDFLK